MYQKNSVMVVINILAITLFLFHYYPGFSLKSEPQGTEIEPISSGSSSIIQFEQVF